jgi:hypothetical protein
MGMGAGIQGEMPALTALHPHLLSLSSPRISCAPPLLSLSEKASIPHHPSWPRCLSVQRLPTIITTLHGLTETKDLLKDKEKYSKASTPLFPLHPTNAFSPPIFSLLLAIIYPLFLDSFIPLLILGYHFQTRERCFSSFQVNQTFFYAFI